MTATEAPTLTRAERNAELRAEREAEAARIIDVEAQRWADEWEQARSDEQEAEGAAEASREAAAQHRWRAARPSDLWPYADLESIAAEQTAAGFEARAVRARERRRGAAWNLAKLKRSHLIPEEADDWETRRARIMDGAGAAALASGTEAGQDE